MSVVQDIFRSYRTPGAVYLERLPGVTEANAFAILVGATLIIFASQWPRIARDAHFDPSIPFDARIGGAILGIVFVYPLVAYVFAGLLWMALRLVGKGVSGVAVRLALFWSLLAATPFWLAHGFLAGFLGQGAIVDIVGIAVIVAFVFVLVGALRALIGSGSTV